MYKYFIYFLGISFTLLIRGMEHQPEDRGKNREMNQQNEESALLEAYSQGKFDEAVQLLKKKASSKTHDSDDIPGSKSSASSIQDKQTIELEIDADQEMPIDYAKQLLEASKKNYMWEVEESLNKEIDVNICDNEGNTPLILAVINGHLHLVEYLIERDANLKHCNNGGHTALFYAMKNNKTDIYKLLNEHLDTDEETEESETPIVIEDSDRDVNLNEDERIKCEKEFLQACGNGRLDTIKELLDIGIDINACDDQGNTGLIYAVIRGCSNIFEYLLEHGADVNKPNKYGCTVLNFLKNNQHPKIIALFSENTFLEEIKKILNNGGDINGSYGNNGNTLLISAAERGYLRTVKYLVSQGANIDEFSNLGYTSLIHAAFNNHLDIVCFLVENGVDKDFQDPGLRNTALIVAIAQGHEEIAKYLILLGADVNKRNYQDQTALMYAAQKNFKDIASLLIRIGADKSCSDKSKMTVCDWAVNYGNQDLADILRCEDKQQENNFSNSGIKKRTIDHMLSPNIQQPVNNSNVSSQAMKQQNGVGVGNKKTKTTIDLSEDEQNEKTSNENGHEIIGNSITIPLQLKGLMEQEYGIICPCGALLRQRSVNPHYKTLRHQAWARKNSTVTKFQIIRKIHEGKSIITAAAIS